MATSFVVEPELELYLSDVELAISLF